MRSLRRILTTGTVAALAAGGLVVAATPAYAAGTTYYVDATSGSDAAAGTSASSAWKSLDKVNGTTFTAGDRILFHGGQTWNGRLSPQGSGASGNPITLGSYDTGRPKIDGASLPGGGAIQLTNQSYWTIDGFEVVSNSGVDNLGTPDVGRTTRSGVLIADTNESRISGITITDNYVHNVNGCYHCADGDLDSHANGGIVFSVPAGLFNSGYGQGSYVDSTISDNRIDDVGRTGIGFTDLATGGFFAADPGSLSTNTKITGNTVTNVDGDGILLWGSQSNLIEHNVVGNAGRTTIPGFKQQPSAAGLWPTHSVNTTIQYNEVYGTKTQNGVDGQGYDIDQLATNTTVQYNYSHDNQGGFLLTQGGTLFGFAGSYNATVRYNLSVNDATGTGNPADAKGVITQALGVLNNTSIYNNTIYVPTGSPARVMYCDSCGVDTDPWSFRNNIVVNHGSGDYVLPPSNGGTIDHNVFYGNHPASEPADANKITTDPQLVSPAATAPLGITSVSGYKIATTSPAVGSGAVIADNGGKDYFGNPVSATAAPSRGFHEPVR